MTEWRQLHGIPLRVWRGRRKRLAFLFNAMAPKADPAFPFQGRPQLLYLDNGPVAKSRVFQTVMQALGIAWQTHVPAGKDGTRVTARSKGKVERPFPYGQGSPRNAVPLP